MKNVKKIVLCSLSLFILGLLAMDLLLPRTVSGVEVQLREYHDQLVEAEVVIERDTKEEARLQAELDKVQANLALWEGKHKEVSHSIDDLVDPLPEMDLEVGNFIPTRNGGIDDFLRVNGAEFVKEAGDLFRASGTLHAVSPELLVCIAQADSSLGNALKSTNNIGNVGNNDSGNVVHYASLNSAISAIGSVLNNKYLRGNTMIGQLSGGGRKAINSKYECSNSSAPYKCYASSIHNWNKNVKSCLQNILQDSSIDETWEFRVKS